MRRLRIVKYRGTFHGSNEYPFLLDEKGFSVLPITSVGIGYEASKNRISSGIPRLDKMLGGNGYYVGSTILISGTAGTGKTSISAKFAENAYQNKKRVIYFTFEESPAQLIRNMNSIGINLAKGMNQNLLQIHSSRPTNFGNENHLNSMIKTINDFKPEVVVLDPVNSFVSGEQENEVKYMLMRFVDFLKSKQITMFFTSLTQSGGELETSEISISSLVDTWMLIRDIENGGERNRGLYIIKSRGMAHSNQIREFLLTSKGIELLDVYSGDGEVLTGSARIGKELEIEVEKISKDEELEYKQIELERKRKLKDAQIELIQSEFNSEKIKIQKDIEFGKAKLGQSIIKNRKMVKSRKGD
jgi:circadian clock protein KaiC